MNLEALWEKYWWIVVVALVVALTAAVLYFAGCSVSVESGIHDSLHADQELAQPTPTPTPGK